MCPHENESQVVLNTSPLGYWPIKIKSDRKDDFIRGTMLFRDKTGKSKDTRFSEEMYHCS